MAAKFQSLKDEEIVRIAKGKVVMSGVAAFTELIIDTQLSIERGVIWLINAIEFFVGDNLHELSGVLVTGEETINVHMARESKNAILDHDEADLIQKYTILTGRSPAIGTDSGPLSFILEQPKVFTYSPALPYAGQNLFFGLNATTTSVVTAFVRIRYTIRSVSDKYFFRVAQALLG